MESNLLWNIYKELNKLNEVSVNGSTQLLISKYKWFFQAGTGVDDVSIIELLLISKNPG